MTYYKTAGLDPSKISIIKERKRATDSSRVKKTKVRRWDKMAQ